MRSPRTTTVWSGSVRSRSIGTTVTPTNAVTGVSAGCGCGEQAASPSASAPARVQDIVVLVVRVSGDRGPGSPRPPDVAKGHAGLGRTTARCYVGIRRVAPTAGGAVPAAAGSAAPPRPPAPAGWSPRSG